MRRLLVLLSAFWLLTIFAASDVSAARPSFDFSFSSVTALFRAGTFPFCGSFFFITEGEIPLVDDGTGCILGGDADDFGNGRITGEGINSNSGSTLTTTVECTSDGRTVNLRLSRN